MDRRALVFLGFAAVNFALYPLADHFDGASGWAWGDTGWAWVPVVLGIIYVVLAVLSALDAWSRSKLQPRPLGYDRTPPAAAGTEAADEDPDLDRG